MEVAINTLDQTGGPQMECNTERIKGLVEELAGAVAAAMVGGERTDLLQLEGRLCEVMQTVDQASLRQILEGIEGRYPAPAVACPCGEVARYRYRRQGTLLTHFGWVRYRHSYYVCDEGVFIDSGKFPALSKHLRLSRHRHSHMPRREFLLKIDHNGKANSSLVRFALP